jgi:nucleotide-binding universal stress UspA family protein
MSKEKDTYIVMGTTGEGDSFKKIFGSLSLDMIDKAYCPLFLVPPGAGFSNVKEVTYLSEDLKNDTNHLLFVGRLCAKMSLNFRLVHYRNKNEGEYDISNTIKIMESYFPEVKYHIDVMDTDDLFASVKEMVTVTPDNLIVLSTKHRNIFQNLFHKSVTEFAAIHSISPLLILTDKTEES